MKKIRNILALICLTAIIFSMLTICCEAEEISEDEKSGPLLPEPVTISVLAPSHPSYPYQEDWYVFDLIKEKTNITFDMTTADVDSFADKANLVMASGHIPDCIFLVDTLFVQQYASQGAFINVLDYIDKMPNFKAWYEENMDYVANYLAADGNLYSFPQKGVGETNRRLWMYRKDIFEKLGLNVPTTKDEFYDVLVKLKEAYPDSYPLAFRQFNNDMRQLNMLSPSWGAEWPEVEDSRYMGYDFENKEFVYGPITDEFKEMLQFYNKLYEEGLIIPNFLTIDTKGWQDVMANGDSFITLDYISRIDFYNNAMQGSDPEYQMDYMRAPVFNEKIGDKLGYSAKANDLFVVSSQTKHLDEVLAYIDWLYTDEAEDLMSWGRPGDLYTEDENGVRHWKEFKTAADMKKGTGFQTYAVYLRYNFDAESSTFGENAQKARKDSVEHELAQQPVLVYNDEEKEIINTVALDILNHTYEQVSKFLIGERSFDEWDQYVKEIEDLGLDQLKDVQEQSYARVLAVKAK